MSYGIFAILLLTLITVDSWVTASIIGAEANPLYLKIMELTNMTLGQVMFWRIPILAILVYFIYRYGTKNVNVVHATVLYFLMYIGLVGIQFFHYMF